MFGCASKDLNYSPKEVYRDFNALWQSSFKDEKLNELIKSALEKNEDLGVGALNLAIALQRAGIKKLDLFPSLNSDFGGSFSRNIDMHQSWQKGFNSEFALSWQLDIYGKIYDIYTASNYEAVKTALNYDDLRISIVNSVIDEYYRILFLNDELKNLKQNLENLTKLHEIVKLKYNYGKEQLLSVHQSTQNLLSLNNSILRAQEELENAYEKLNNLTSNQEKFDEFGLDRLEIDDFSIDLNTDELTKNIKNRPDINAAIAALNAGFYDYRASQKAFYPTISIGASLSDKDDKLKDAFGFNLFGTNVRVNLPFLDYFRLKDNLKISEYEFNILKLNYEKSLKNAINETIKYANFYKIDKQNYQNLKLILEQNTKILEIYEQKYDLGRAELKDLLEARNNLINSQNSLLNQKYILLSDKISFLRASGQE